MTGYVYHAWLTHCYRPEFWLTNSPGHVWRDKWTALSGPLSTGYVYHAWLTHRGVRYLQYDITSHITSPSRPQDTPVASQDADQDTQVAP